MDELEELYQQVILDHAHSPRQFFIMPQPSAQARGYNPLCGDDLTVFLKLKENDAHRVDSISFNGHGCAISMASGSLMAQQVQKKQMTKQETLDFANQVLSFLLQDDNPCEHSTLDALKPLAGVKRFPMRVKCATLAWHALVACLKMI